MGSHHHEEPKAKSCCTWPKLMVAAIAMIVSGILIWQFAPIDEAINNILPTFNNTGVGDAGNNGNSGVGQDVTPSEAPTNPGVALFDFMQCTDPQGNDCCNGLDGGFCDLRVDEAMFATNHNANADWETGFWISPNHQYKLEDSLIAGYRGINIDVCNCGGEIVLCHGRCEFNSRDVYDVIVGINTFLDENPTEVLMLALELNSEAGLTVDLDQLYAVLQEVPGFVEKFYQHPNITTPWPTFRQLVSTNERVIAFHYRGPSCDESAPCPPGMHWYHRYAVNTQWNIPNLASALDYQTACTFARNPEASSKTFFGLNNFVVPPDQAVARTMNEYNFIVERAAACSSQNEDLAVNFVYSDFWSEGDLPRLVQDRNAVKARRRLAFH